MADQQLSDEQFRGILDKARQAAPDGLNADQLQDFMDRYVDDALAALPAGPDLPPEKKGSTRKGGWEDVLPDVFGAVGSLASKVTPLRAAGPVGSVTAAGLMGGAGEGYRQLIKHATELPGVMRDVASHAMNPETRAATWEGAKQGMAEGTKKAVTAGGKQALIEGVGQGIGRGLQGASAGMKVINASPVARQHGLTWENLVTGLGAVAGGKSGGGLGAGGGAIAGRMMGSPQTFNAVTALLDQAGKKLPIADLLRGLDAYRNRPTTVEPEDE